METILTIEDAVVQFIELTKDARSSHTARTYANSLNAFLLVIEENGGTKKASINTLDAEPLRWFLKELKYFSPATEQVYVVAVSRFYQYLVAEELADLNLERMKMLIQTRSRRPGVRLPQFPKEDIEKLIHYAENEITKQPFENEKNQLRNLRDAAFILTLADTGMRVHEICSLRRGDVDWQEYRAVIIGKGDKQALVRFSSRSIFALRTYINTRAKIDGASGRPLPSLPLFARHDRGSGSKIKPITTATGRNIIKQRVAEVLGDEGKGTITPHSFRHYFVTNVLQGSGGNLKLAQELARHKNIQVTQRYAHLSDDELDRGYYDIFEDGVSE